MHFITKESTTYNKELRAAKVMNQPFEKKF
jgi:hypothetical protein